MKINKAGSYILVTIQSHRAGGINNLIPKLRQTKSGFIFQTVLIACIWVWLAYCKYILYHPCWVWQYSSKNVVITYIIWQQHYSVTKVLWNSALANEEFLEYSHKNRHASVLIFMAITHTFHPTAGLCCINSKAYFLTSILKKQSPWYPKATQDCPISKKMGVQNYMICIGYLHLWSGKG